MALTSGFKLGSYQIGSPLGAGGMGEVYRARDSRLGRDVAVKVLPTAMAGNPEIMARFEREAQFLASLNHTNIATIYGLEESGATRALVMELVEGPTLAERIGTSVAAVYDRRAGEQDGAHRAPLQLEEALPIAKQIAEALEYAHEKGIIHRDLKPANVKVTPEGTVKILDFGLAKAIEMDPSASALANSPTTVTATRAGVILGTAAYMAPEQAKAKPLDRRADIWAFGCVLFEMLTGQQAFEGETVSDVLAAVIMKDPDWGALPASTPESIRKLLRRCLEKDSKRRLRDIGEARIAIDETLSGRDSVASPTGTLPLQLSPSATGTLRSAPGQASPHQPPTWRRALPWAIALALAVLSAALAWRTYFHPSAPPAEAMVSFIPAPPGTTFRSTGFGAGPVVVSPDGKQLAFSATGPDGVTKIWVRPLSAATAAPVAGTEDAASPFWSADSRSLGFYAGGKLKTIDLSGGNAQVLADARPGGSSRFGDSAWGPNGIILFKPPQSNAIYRIPASGGTPVAATRLGKDETNHYESAFLPDGKHFLYVARTTHGLYRIAMGSLDSEESKLVLEDAYSPAYAAGFLFFSKQGNEVFAQPFDPDTAKISGKAIPLANAGRVSAAGDAILAYQEISTTSRLEWFDHSGNPLGTLGEVAEHFSPKISPDGKHVLAIVGDPQSGTEDLWSFPVSGGVSTRLTFGPGDKAWSVWSPDGKYIAYGTATGENRALFRKPADGSGEAENLFTLPEFRPVAVDWSPDGRSLSYDVYNSKEGREENWVLPLVGDKKPFQVAHVDASQYDGNFSPDGRWFAYFSYESGRPEVYVVPFPGPGGKYQISHTGGWLVRWAKAGKLFYSTLGNRLMEADLALGSTSLQVKSIHPLFEMNLPNTAAPLFDVTPDGEKFVAVTSDRPESSSITLVTNWTALLKKK